MMNGDGTDYDDGGGLWMMGVANVDCDDGDGDDDGYGACV